MFYTDIDSIAYFLGICKECLRQNYRWMGPFVHPFKDLPDFKVKVLVKDCVKPEIPHSHIYPGLTDENVSVQFLTEPFPTVIT
jgi:hypothetical protein